MTVPSANPLTLPDAHLGLYVHVPFCVRKCRYCDFPSAPPADDGQIDAYLDALAREAAERRAALHRPLHSIFIGGGTPTLLSAGQLTRLWDEVIAPFPRLPDAEITLEANPGTLTAGKLAALAALPITRVSLGAQSLHADELRRLGRIHTPDAVEASVAALRAAGIAHINLDLIYAFPGHTAARWRETLRRALALRPEHLSCYALILEEETPLFAEVAAGISALPGEEEEERIMACTDELLAAAGLAPYEVSNAAKPGDECRHNLGYWLGRDYLGLGLAAASTLGPLRWRNVTDFSAYLAGAGHGGAMGYAERLSAPARLLERVMLGLRLRAGFDLAAAEAACGCTLEAIAGNAAATLCDEGFLLHDGRWLRLTPVGYPLANQVITRLMAAENGRAE